jgi:hypothetical protein
MEATESDGSLVKAATEAARGGSRSPSLSLAAGYRRPRLWTGHLDGGTFLLGGARALPEACAAASYATAALVCSVGHGGTKRARAARVVLPASAPPLGFGAWGGGATEAAAAGGME